MSKLESNGHRILENGMEYLRLPFAVSGAPDKRRRMRLEVTAALPEGAELILVGPAEFLDSFSERPGHASRTKDILHWPLNPHGPNVLGEALFPAGKNTVPVHLRVHIPQKHHQHSYEIYVRQVFQELEVGRITWCLAPKA